MSRSFYENDALNYDEDEADEWRHPRQSQKKEIKYDDYQERSAPKRNPEEVWLIPPNVRPVDILGEKRIHLQRIENLTNTHMVYNEDEAQIEMWGSREDIEQALKQWCALAETVLTKELQERSKRKVKGWAKPEKALTEKQKQKIERRKAREQEERDYRGFPAVQKPFNGHFVFPNSDIPISRIIGEKEETLHPVRAETKCYMWYEPGSNLIRIAGDTYGSVEEATMRVKHLYIKVVASRSIPTLTTKDKVVIYKGWVYHMIEPPHKPYKVRIANPAPWFNKPHDIPESGLFKLLEPVLEGDKISVVGKNGGSRDLNPNSNFDALHNIRVSNVRRIEDALLNAFGTIHLFDEEIKMRIRFGHVCLTDFPREPLWPIDRLNDKILSDSRLQSKFATCVATDRKQLDPLFEILSDCERQWDGTPFREFKISVIRKPPPQMGRNNRAEPWPCAFDVQFKDDGKIGLWNVTTHEKNILDINMSCLDNFYSWKLNIKTAKRLPNDKFNALGTFVYKLRLSKNNHLVYSNTDEIHVTSVCEKTRWKYWWGDNYVVEVTRYKFWNLTKYVTNPSGVEVPLDKEQATVTYGVSLYRKSWEDNFAFNCNLNVGETPEWHPYDIMEETGGVNVLLSEIRNFLDVLQEKLPMPEGNGQ